MMPLHDVRLALEDVLRQEGYNVSDGETLTAPGARVSLFTMAYHRVIGEGSTAMATANVLVAVARADSDDATRLVDEAQTTLWLALEAAAGPWLAIVVRGALPDSTQQGDATYASLNLETEVYV